MFKKNSIFFFAFIALIAILLLPVAVLNIYFDPLLSFFYLPTTKKAAPVIDARLQKTNRLVHGKSDYDAVLIGSSRVEQFRAQDFGKLHVFNYAMPSFYPDEADQYIALFLSKNHRKPNFVFLGLDFYGSNLKAFEHAKPPSHYIETSSTPVYALKTALSLDTLKYSLRVAREKPAVFTYDRNNLDKLTRVLSKQESESLVRKDLSHYNKTFYGDYQYNTGYIEVLRVLKKHHPDINLVIFTTPVSAELFKLLVKNNRLPDLERWLKELVEVFGGVYNFMFLSPLSKDQSAFLDGHHLYPERAAPMARIISGQALPKDWQIGEYVTKENLAQHLIKLRAEAKHLAQEINQ